jgi:hypothetical protein
MLLQLWRVAVNKKLRTKDKWWPPAWELEVGLRTLQRKKKYIYYEKPNSLGPGRILWINSPRDGIWT